MSLRDWLRGRPKPESAVIARVKAWAVAAVPEATVAVNEIVCLDPGCPGPETVILIMQPGRKTRAAKVGKPIDEVTEEDVAEALARVPPSPQHDVVRP
jgi:hypothetical protein